MPKTKQAKSLITQANILKLKKSLVEAVGIEEEGISEADRRSAQERTWDICLMAGCEIARTGKCPVLHYSHLVNFINLNRKRIHKFVFITEPYQESEYTAIIMIPSEVAEKILVLGWPKPTED